MDYKQGRGPVDHVPWRRCHRALGNAVTQRIFSKTFYLLHSKLPHVLRADPVWRALKEELEGESL